MQQNHINALIFHIDMFLDILRRVVKEHAETIALEPIPAGLPKVVHKI